MQTAVTLSIFLAVVGLVAYVLNVHVQNGQIDDSCHRSSTARTHVVDPPPGVALAMRAGDGPVAVSPRAPAATARLTDGPVGYSSVYDGGHRYRAPSSIASVLALSLFWISRLGRPPVGSCSGCA